MSDEITKEMAEAGANVLCALSDQYSRPGHYRFAIEAAKEVFRAMAAKAPKQATGKAEPPPGWPSDEEV